jgi:hypothetical protein
MSMISPVARLAAAVVLPLVATTLGVVTAGGVASADPAPPGQRCLAFTINSKFAFGGTPFRKDVQAGQGATWLVVTNTGPTPATVSIVDESGAGNREPNQSPAQQQIGAGGTASYAYWGGLDAGGTRNYSFSIEPITPGYSFAIGFEVWSNRCPGAPPKQLLQFSLGGTCAVDCDDPHITDMMGGTLNIDLNQHTYDLRNMWSQRELGLVSVAGSNPATVTLLGFGGHQDTVFTVNYDNATGSATSVTYVNVFHDRGHTRQSSSVTTTEVLSL